MGLQSRNIDFFVFSGTGNSLLIAEAMSEAFRREGLSVSLKSMEKPCPPLESGTAMALVFPVAFFSTYPTVWRFIHALPPGEGREVFLAGTMGGVSFGMHAPMNKVLIKKGYKPVGHHFFVMPGNYNNRKIPVRRNAARLKKSMEEVVTFTADLLSGDNVIKGGIPLVSYMFYRMAQTRWPWNFFYKLFPFKADHEKCVKCGRCAENCPEGAIKLSPYPEINTKLCQSCQRCVGFCPVEAFYVPGKPAEPYRAMSFDEFTLEERM